MNLKTLAHRLFALMEPDISPITFRPQAMPIHKQSIRKASIRFISFSLPFLDRGGKMQEDPGNTDKDTSDAILDG